MKNILLCLVNVLIMVAGQVLFRYGAKDKTFDSFSAVVSVVFTPVVLLALFLYVCTTVLWLYILSSVPLSFAYPIQALAFPLVLILSMFLFKEPISISGWIGVAIIFIGVIVTTR